MGKVFAMKKVQMHCEMCAFVNCSLQGGLGLKGAKENRPRGAKRTVPRGAKPPNGV